MCLIEASCFLALLTVGLIGFGLLFCLFSIIVSAIRIRGSNNRQRSSTHQGILGLLFRFLLPASLTIIFSFHGCRYIRAGSCRINHFFGVQLRHAHLSELRGLHVSCFSFGILLQRNGIFQGSRRGPSLDKEPFCRRDCICDRSIGAIKSLE